MAQNIASGHQVAPAGGEQTFLVGPVAGRAPHVVVGLANPVSAGGIEIWTHPMAPPPAGEHVGTYYPYATQVAIATGAIAVGDVATLITAGDDRTFRQFGVTVRNNDVITHDVNLDVTSEGDGAEG